MLHLRLIFGTLLILALLGLFALDEWLGRTALPPGLVLLAAALMIAGAGGAELARLLRGKGVPTGAGVLGAAGAAGVIWLYLAPGIEAPAHAAGGGALLAGGVLLGAMALHACPQRRTAGAMQAGGAALLAMVYLGLLPGFYLLIRAGEPAWVVAAVLLVTKACDIGAYATGRALGRRKLIPWLSPGKTWEGLAGGLALAMLLAVALAALSNSLDAGGKWVQVNSEYELIKHDWPLWYAAVAGLVIGAVGQAGDLLASLMKRDAGLKDSGSSIPGFGGLLDVIDSPLLAAPVAWMLLEARYALA